MRTSLASAGALRLLMTAALSLGAFACSSSVQIGADDGDGGVRPDGSSGEPCGANTCSVGEACCNPSCGICTSAGEACSLEICDEPVVCDGVVCEGEGAQCCPGCSGSDAVCAAPGESCPLVFCPADCLTDADCGPAATCCLGCDEGSTGTCISADQPCPDVACGPECGDDVCSDAEQCCPGSGCPGDPGPTCVSADRICPPAPFCPAPSCEPFDAWGEGLCEAELGVKWNGTYCESFSGCSCSGSDCPDLYPSLEDCQSVHDSCPPSPECSVDADCPSDMYCEGCAHGSCPVCGDCVAACVPHGCPSVGEAVCTLPRPDCGPNATAVVADGCWECVDVTTCQPVPEPDCRETGCGDDERCELCWTSYACIPAGVSC